MLTQPDQPSQINNPPTPQAITGEYQAVDQFDMDVDNGLYSADHKQLADQLQRALAYVSKRFGHEPTSRFKALVLNDDRCRLHGLAYTDVRTVQVFTCNDIAEPRAVAIMAHEFVHQLAQDYYGPPHLNADMILSEGLATWGAGDYWLSGQPDFRTYVRQQRKAGVFYPLATDYTNKDISVMNALYYEWASFVEFLIKDDTAHSEFDRLYVSGQGMPGTADYTGVYGKNLDTLQKEWQAWLDQPS